LKIFQLFQMPYAAATADVPNRKSERAAAPTIGITGANALAFINLSSALPFDRAPSKEFVARY
jgi:hypothetical protein